MITYTKQLFKVPVIVHWSTSLAFILSLSVGGPTSLLYTVMAFICVFFHEHGHIYAANKYGYRTVNITFSFLGGAAYIPAGRNLPYNKDFVISIAGPAVNFILAVISILLYTALDFYVFRVIFEVNLGLLLFNLIPAYPLDGGRILKSVLLFLKIRRDKAEKIVMYVAKALAIAFCVIGFKFNLYMLMAVSVFIWISSERH